MSRENCVSRLCWRTYFSNFTALFIAIQSRHSCAIGKSHDNTERKRTSERRKRKSTEVWLKVLRPIIMHSKHPSTFATKFFDQNEILFIHSWIEIAHELKSCCWHNGHNEPMIVAKILRRRRVEEWTRNIPLPWTHCMCVLCSVQRRPLLHGLVGWKFCYDDALCMHIGRSINYVNDSTQNS